MSAKHTTKKTNTKSIRIYFFVDNIEDLDTLKNHFTNKPAFMDTIYLSKSITKDKTNLFINIRLNVEVNEDQFIKMSKKINKILDKKYIIYYSDNVNKYSYIHKDILDEMQNSLNLFIDDD